MSKISQQRKIDILNAAYEEFVRSGIDGTSMTDIASRAGIGKSTIYEYFPSKSQLLSEACLLFVADMEEKVMACFAGDGTLQGKMVTYCTIICQYMSMVEVMGNLASKSVDNGNALRSIVEDHIKGYTQRVETVIGELLCQGKTQGEIGVAVDVEVAAVMLQSLPSMQLVWGLERRQVEQGIAKTVALLFAGLQG